MDSDQRLDGATVKILAGKASGLTGVRTSFVAA